MRLVQLGIYVLVAYSVLAFGAVDPLSEFILEIGAVGLLLVWFLQAVRRRRVDIRLNSLYLPFLGFCSVGLVQFALGLTAYPYASKVELLRMGAYLLLSFLAVESIQSEKEREAFVWFLMTLAFIVSLFGVLQFFAWNGKLYWVRAVTNAGTSFGPFVDRDHFAGFVELTAPFAFALLLSGAIRREILPLVCLFGILPVGAVVLSASRGGILSLFSEMVLLGALLGRRIIARKKLLSVALVTVSCVAMIAWLGIEGATQRFEDFASSEVSQDRRMSMYADTWRIFLDHPWVGTGLGTLQFVYPRYETRYDGYIVDHTHNDYLELLSDTGVVGGICGFFFILFLFRQGFSNLRNTLAPFGGAFYCGALAACAGFLVHSVVDFNLHIPSNALLFFLIAFTASSSRRNAFLCW
jgi:O-antigen ligase